MPEGFPNSQPFQGIEGIQGIGDFINLLTQNIPPVSVPSYESGRPRSVKPSSAGVASDSIAALVNTLASFGQLQRNRSDQLLNAAQVSGSPAQFLNQPSVRQQVGSTLVPGGQAPEFTPSLKEQEAIAAGKLARGEIKVGDPESLVIPGVANQVWRSEKLKQAATYANERAVNQEVDRLTKDRVLPNDQIDKLRAAVKDRMMLEHLSQHPMEQTDIMANSSMRLQTTSQIDEIMKTAQVKSDVKLKNDLTKIQEGAAAKLLGKVPGLKPEHLQAMTDIHTLPPGPERDAAMALSAQAGEKMSGYATTLEQRNSKMAEEKIKNFRSLIQNRTDALDIRRDTSQRQWTGMFFQQEMRAKAKAISEENKLATEEYKNKTLMGFKPGEEPKAPEMKELSDSDVQDALGFALEQVRGMKGGKPATVPGRTSAPAPSPSGNKVFRFDSSGNPIQ